MINELLEIILLTFTPFLELRASIPYAFFSTDMPFAIALLVIILTNIIVGIFAYFFLDKFIHLFLRIKIIKKIYDKWVTKTQHKIQKYVDKYGVLGVSIFIGIPLPGSGSYSGALGSYLIGLNFKKFFIANIIGVLIAGFLVTLVTVTGTELFNFFIKIIQ